MADTAVTETILLFDPNPDAEIILRTQLPIRPVPKNACNHLALVTKLMTKEEKNSFSGECRPLSPSAYHPDLVDPPQVYRLRVSWKHLALASPVFRKMFTKPWLKRESEDRPLHEIAASDWDATAFVIVMNIIHGHHLKVPMFCNVATMVQIAFIADYYDCAEIVDIFVSRWERTLHNCTPRNCGADIIYYLCVGWVFSRPSIYQPMAQLALRYTQGTFSAMDLPVGNILRQ